MTVFTVTTLDDSTDATDGQLSLREAIALTNNGTGGDTIVFDSSLKGELLRLNGTEIEITKAVEIDATGLNITITADANGDDATVGNTHITDMAASNEYAAGYIQRSDSDPDGKTTLDDNSRIFNITDANAQGNCASEALNYSFQEVVAPSSFFEFSAV